MAESTVLSLRVPPDLASQLGDLASQCGLTRSQYILQILTAHLGESTGVNTLYTPVNTVDIQSTLATLQAQLADHDARLGELRG